MSALTLTLALFCLPTVPADTQATVQPKKEVDPPKAISDQFCIHLSIPNGSGGWKWDRQATHCENSESLMCDYICRNYSPAHGYTRVDCGCMATADMQYVIVPPRHTPDDTPVTQIICICLRTPYSTPYLSTCSPCAPVCKPTCERPRLFPLFRRCR